MKRDTNKRKVAVPASVVLPRAFRLRLVILTVVTLIAGGLVCRRAAQLQPRDDDHARYHDRSFRVTRVVDGDTLDIDVPDGAKPVTRIRLWGVDTPETARSPRGEMYYGPEASRFAKRTLLDREVHVVLADEKTRGYYGRLLAYVYLERGGRMFNEMLLEEGYAYADLRYKHHYYTQFKAIEKRARKEGRGLWKGVTPEKMPPWKQRFETRATSSGQ